MPYAPAPVVIPVCRLAETGLFLTGLGGEITLIPGNERVDVTVTIESGKSLPVIGPIFSLGGIDGLPTTAFPT